MTSEPEWLVWVRELQAIAQTGLTFVQDPFDRERYEQVRALSARMMAALGGGADPASIEALFAEQSGYATPKIDVRGAVFRDDGALLMVREATDGRWSLPGGWADINQSGRESVEREIREEAGFEVEIRKLAAVYDRAKHGHIPPRPFHVYKLFFVCALAGGSARTSLETTEIGFFREDDLPPDISVGRVMPHQIARMFEHWRSPDMPTEFD